MLPPQNLHTSKMTDTKNFLPRLFNRFDVHVSIELQISSFSLHAYLILRDAYGLVVSGSFSLNSLISITEGGEGIHTSCWEDSKFELSKVNTFLKGI